METLAKRARKALAIAYDTSPQPHARPAKYSLSWHFDAGVIGMLLLTATLYWTA